MEPISPLQMGWPRVTLTAALLLLTMIGAAAALFVLPPAYQSGSSVVLLASQVASKPYGGNPYLSFSPSLTLTSDVVSSEMMAPSMIGHLAALGYADSYSVQPAPYTTDTTGSVLMITVTGRAKPGVELTLRGVTDEINALLTSLQSGIRPAGRIRAVTISVSPAARSLGSEARLLTVLMGAGLVVSFGIPWAIERRRAARLLLPTALSATAPYPADPVAGDRRATVPPTAAGRGRRH